MFNLFKKKKPSVAVMNATIEQIHSEFDSASERLLKEARDIISKNKLADRGERLRELGFFKAAPVSQSIENKKNEALAAQIEYYQIHYPNNKFITEDLVKSICEKYGLVFGDAHYYKGDVPEKNIKEMESFKLRDEEKERRTNIDDYYMHAQRQASFDQLSNAINRRPVYNHHRISNPPSEVRGYFVQHPFKICAPEKDFDMSVYVRKGYKLEYDPIVLQPVKHGYLIVTKWGLSESANKELLNEKMN